MIKVPMMQTYSIHILDTLQRFSLRGGDSSQEGVAEVQVGDDQCLDQEFHCVCCEERPYLADVVEDSLSTRSGSHKIPEMQQSDTPTVCSGFCQSRAGTTEFGTLGQIRIRCP